MIYPYFVPVAFLVSIVGSWFGYWHLGTVIVCGLLAIVSLLLGIYSRLG